MDTYLSSSLPRSGRASRHLAAGQQADLVVALARSVRAGLRGEDDVRDLLTQLDAASVTLARWLTLVDFDLPSPDSRNGSPIQTAWAIVEIAEDLADLVRRRRFESRRAAGETVDQAEARPGPAMVAWRLLHARILALSAEVE